jgi:hypothetical protein
VNIYFVSSWSILMTFCLIIPTDDAVLRPMLKLFRSTFLFSFLICLSAFEEVPPRLVLRSRGSEPDGALLTDNICITLIHGDLLKPSRFLVSPSQQPSLYPLQELAPGRTTPRSNFYALKFHWFMLAQAPCNQYIKPANRNLSCGW